MALVSDGFYAYFTIVDNGGDSATLSYGLVAADATEAATAAGTIATRLAAVTNGIIKAYSITERFIENALTLPGSGVHVEDRASVVVQLASSPLKSSVLVIPAPKAGLFMATSGDASNDIDVSATNTALRSYVAMFNDGGSGICTISDGEFVDADAANTGIKRGVRTHRASSRG